MKAIRSELYRVGLEDWSRQETLDYGHVVQAMAFWDAVKKSAEAYFARDAQEKNGFVAMMRVVRVRDWEYEIIKVTWNKRHGWHFSEQGRAVRGVEEQMMPVAA